MEVQKSDSFHTTNNNNNNNIQGKLATNAWTPQNLNLTPSHAFKAINEQNGTIYFTKFLTLHPSNAQNLDYSHGSLNPSQMLPRV